MLKVPYGQDPYSVIGKYIRDHITAIEDMIAVIEIDGIATNQLFMVDWDEENCFIWKNDWYEGEEDVALTDFFPVSEATNQSAQPEPCEDAVNRKDVINFLCDWICAPMVRCNESGNKCGCIRGIKALPSAQPERKSGKWINHRNDNGHNIADCDRCGHAIQWFDGDETPMYCCMCGSYNGGEQDG